MADDIVSFGMEIDSSAAQKAKRDLNDLAKSGPAVEQALGRLKSAGAAGAAGVTAVGAAAANVKAETDRMRQAVVTANSSLGALVRGLGSLGAIAGIGGTLSLGAIFGKFISETKNAQMEQAQLAAVLKSTGMAAGFTRAELNAMASDMAAMSTFTAGEINQAQTRLLSYSNIAHEMFPRAMQAVIDTSIRMGMSVTQAAETVGRALDIPSEGLASLSRQGFRFTDEQKKMAKALEDTGRIAEAQGIVIEALESSYGGAAAAARNTLEGALQALQNQISDLMTGDDDSVRGLTQGGKRPDLRPFIRRNQAGVCRLRRHVTRLGWKLCSSHSSIQELADRFRRHRRGVLCRLWGLLRRSAASSSRNRRIGKRGSAIRWGYAMGV